MLNLNNIAKAITTATRSTTVNPIINVLTLDNLSSVHNAVKTAVAVQDSDSDIDLALIDQTKTDLVLNLAVMTYNQASYKKLNDGFKAGIKDGYSELLIEDDASFRFEQLANNLWELDRTIIINSLTNDLSQYTSEGMTNKAVLLSAAKALLDVDQLAQFKTMNSFIDGACGKKSRSITAYQTMTSYLRLLQVEYFEGETKLKNRKGFIIQWNAKTASASSATKVFDVPNPVSKMAKLAKQIGNIEDHAELHELASYLAANHLSNAVAIEAQLSALLPDIIKSNSVKQQAVNDLAALEMEKLAASEATADLKIDAQQKATNDAIILANAQEIEDQKKTKRAASNKKAAKTRAATKAKKLADVAAKDNHAAIIENIAQIAKDDKAQQPTADQKADAQKQAVSATANANAKVKIAAQKLADVKASNKPVAPVSDLITKKVNGVLVTCSKPIATGATVHANSH